MAAILPDLFEFINSMGLIYIYYIRYIPVNRLVNLFQFIQFIQVILINFKRSILNALKSQRKGWTTEFGHFYHFLERDFSSIPRRNDFKHAAKITNESKQTSTRFPLLQVVMSHFLLRKQRFNPDKKFAAWKLDHMMKM